MSDTPNDTTEPIEHEYKDDDLVYADPDNRCIVGKVEWSKNGKPKPLLMPEKERTGDKEDGDKRRPPRKRYYPWGTHKTMCKIYKIHGKHREETVPKSLDEAMQLALKEPFWD